MFDLKQNIILGLIIHVIFGLMAASHSSVATIWGWSVALIGLFLVFKTRNRNGIAHFCSGYLVGLEVLLRMTGADVFWEFGKYGVILLLGLALIIEKTPKKIPVSILIFALFLLPAIVLNDSNSLNVWRQQIAFNLSGPVSIVIASIYFFRRSIDKNSLSKLIWISILPIIAMVVVTYVRMGGISTISFTGESNFQTSGGFGPNQVSTILGFGVVIIGLAILLKIPISQRKWLDYSILAFFTAFGFLTFSRGGMISAILSLGCGWLLLLLSKHHRKTLSFFRGVTIIILAVFVWNVISDLTAGTLSDRYSSVIWQADESILSNRLIILRSDLQIFGEHFWLGSGVGNSTGLHEEYLFGRKSAAHTEFSRLLAEHGLFGAICIGILVVLPLGILIKSNHINNKILLITFISLAFLTMFHSAMRLAMPGFIYGLALIRLEENP